MATVFIAGSITIKHLDPKVQVRLMNIIEMKHDVIVGDASGVDRSVQQFLFENGAKNVTVYCVGGIPRNNVGNWPTNTVTTHHPRGSRASFAAKDLAMAEVADVGLMVWDTQSIGTLSNVIELLDREKNVVVFIDKGKEFNKITNVSHLESLVTRMTDLSKSKADAKIGLFDRMQKLRARKSELKDELHEKMPEVAAWIDDLRGTFGEEYINKIIAAGMKGEPVFSASENGITIGTPVPTGDKVIKDEQGNPYILVQADGTRTRYDPAADKAYAFATEDCAKVVAKYPDLAPTYGTVAAAQKFAEEAWPNNKADQERFITTTVKTIAEKIAAGKEVPSPKIHETRTKIQTPLVNSQQDLDFS